ncbi:hypothetical protein BLNAU_18391 [Blattamonas nauphoetae]|uniref:Uncharacterized protein n=1 Tax=Blattamonas nauphoetae TaxID=2049346 RepID=A0ABQ9X5W1_9EUKA|nr:hypothetical protein BLNAU_18391 [Blattamonas nauphoetae]
MEVRKDRRGLMLLLEKMLVESESVLLKENEPHVVTQSLLLSPFLQKFNSKTMIFDFTDPVHFPPGDHHCPLLQDILDESSRPETVIRRSTKNHSVFLTFTPQEYLYRRNSPLNYSVDSIRHAQYDVTFVMNSATGEIIFLYRLAEVGDAAQPDPTTRHGRSDPHRCCAQPRFGLRPESSPPLRAWQSLPSHRSGHSRDSDLRSFLRSPHQVIDHTERHPIGDDVHHLVHPRTAANPQAVEEGVLRTFGMAGGGRQQVSTNFGLKLLLDAMLAGSEQVLLKENEPLLTSGPLNAQSLSRLQRIAITGKAREQSNAEHCNTGYLSPLHHRILERMPDVVFTSTYIRHKLRTLPKTM